MTEIWKETPLRHLVDRVDSGTSVNAADVAAEDHELGVLKTSCVSRGFFDPTENKRVNDDERGRVTCQVRPDRLIVSRMNTPSLVGSAGFTDTAPSNLYLPDRLWQISTRNSDAKFLYWWMQSPEYKDQVKLICVGTSSSMQNLSQDDFRSFVVKTPPISRQRVIALFLDRETAQIDGLIGKQEQLIELLAEKRQAIITHAITRGLDPTAPTKPSGIPWLGEVPAHWTITKVKHYFSATLGKMLQSANQPLESSVAIPYLRAGNIQPGGIDLNEVKKMPFTPAEAKALNLRADDLVVVEGGAGFGRSDVLKSDLIGWGFQNHVIRVRSRSSLSTHFLDLVLKMSLSNGQIAKLSNHATIPSLSSDKLLNLEFPAPPKEEAEQIRHHVDRRLIALRNLTDSAESVICLLKERRSALISAAVTGKIAVEMKGPLNA